MVALAAVPEDALVGMVERLEERATTAEAAKTRARETLQIISSIAGLMSAAAVDGNTETAAMGLAYLGRLASDALEQP